MRYSQPSEVPLANRTECELYQATNAHSGLFGALRLNKSIALFIALFYGMSIIFHSRTDDFMRVITASVRHRGFDTQS